tara:strand:- start:329 stop:1378 length:1050 start_codon:yes stop_codon:yes gene_type:complete
MSLGLDIGHFKSKIVMLSGSGENIEALKVDNCDTFNDLNLFDPETITKAQWVASIQDLFKELKINPKGQKDLVSSLIGSSTTIKQILTIEMAGQELVQALEFEAKKHIPLDGTEVIMDYHIVGESSKEVGKIDVLLVATTKNLITQHNQLISEIGFKKTGIFDATPIALTNLCIHNKGVPEQGVNVILNIGCKSTTIVVFGKEQDFFTRELNIAGHKINKSLMDKNSLNYIDAEQSKIEKGVQSLENASTENESFSIQVAEKTIFTNFVEEVRKSLRYYMKTNPQAYFNKIYVTGGSANLVGIKDFISTNLNSEVELLDPFEKIALKDNAENPYQYSIAVGCALRGLSG